MVAHRVDTGETRRTQPGDPAHGFDGLRRHKWLGVSAADVVRPAVFGPYMRARWIISDAGGGAASFTFSVAVWAEGGL